MNPPMSPSMPPSLPPSLNIVLLATAFNGLTQRTYRELCLLHHNVNILVSEYGQIDTDSITRLNPDLIICPFLKEYIPACIWKNYVCLIVHPGVEGDRGPSSLDWAILEQQQTWGVTLLQASETMDAGDVWATQGFAMREASKASLYRREVNTAAISLIKQTLEVIQHNRGINAERQAHTLDYRDSHVKGRWHNPMRQTDRLIGWNNCSQDIVRHINCSDSNPGTQINLAGELFFAFGAKPEPRLSGEQGTILGQANGALCIACGDNAIWIRQLKACSPNAIKLPALLSLNLRLGENQLPNIRHMDHLHSDIHVHIKKHVAYISFDFYNGAMETLQCKKLITEIRKLKLRRDIRVLVFMGGEDFWSNGIHLNCVEASDSPGRTSWANIHAIDDLVAEIILCPKQITVAAVRANAGAGGAVMALACDRVAMRDGVVLTPYYRNMGLHGSEYWSYLMPKRIGLANTQKIRQQVIPILASEALSLGLADEIFNEDWQQYHLAIRQYAKALAGKRCYTDIINYKQIVRSRDEANKPLQAYRNDELEIMQEQFFDPDSDYHRLRHNFIHKIGQPQLPDMLQANRQAATG